MDKPEENHMLISINGVSVNKEEKVDRLKILLRNYFPGTVERIRPVVNIYSSPISIRAVMDSLAPLKPHDVEITASNLSVFFSGKASRIVIERDSPLEESLAKRLH